jgi:hypothetical protein
MSMPVIIWVSRDAVGFTAIGGDTNATTGYVENLAIPTNIAKHLSIVPIEKDQQPSPDFFDAVLQPHPHQEEDYVLDFSASEELFGVHQHTLSSDLSDSGYVNVSRCTCKERCACFTSMVGFENQDEFISDPSFASPTPDLEAQNKGVQWQNWLESQDRRCFTS